MVPETRCVIEFPLRPVGRNALTLKDHGSELSQVYVWRRRAERLVALALDEGYVRDNVGLHPLTLRKLGAREDVMTIKVAVECDPFAEYVDESTVMGGDVYPEEGASRWTGPPGVT